MPLPACNFLSEPGFIGFTDFMIVIACRTKVKKCKLF
ncbi:MAG: hypothetical protein JWP45_1890 [Mucilaginibacter sp.]|jgi:hypothetical protein|nr:hypothetical protein [Mucilaginibacter sp.]MDB5139285.1 hypothetical protein [Mucilaginibacter sp.]